ncbi:hypothetical protein J6590_051485, partial [Homalodisca vitripennis]
ISLAAAAAWMGPCKQLACPAIGDGSEVIFKPLISRLSSKTLDFESELEIAQFQILSVTVEFFMLFIIQVSSNLDRLFILELIVSYGDYRLYTDSHLFLVLVSSCGDKVQTLYRQPVLLGVSCKPYTNNQFFLVLVASCEGKVQALYRQPVILGVSFKPYTDNQFFLVLVSSCGDKVKALYKQPVFLGVSCKPYTDNQFFLVLVSSCGDKVQALYRQPVLLGVSFKSWCTRKVGFMTGTMPYHPRDSFILPDGKFWRLLKGLRGR